MVASFAVSLSRRGKQMIRWLSRKETLQDRADSWMANKLALLKASSQDSMKGHVTKYLLPHFGKMQVKDITEKEGQEFVASLAKMGYISSNATRKMLSPTSIHNTVSVLKLVLGKKICGDWSLSLPKMESKEQWPAQSQARQGKCFAQSRLPG